MADLEALARALGMAVLVEVHDGAELDRALRAADAAGRHQQPQPADLRGHARHHARPAAAQVPADRLLVTESGILGAPTCGACAGPASTPSSSARPSCARADPGARAGRPVPVTADDLPAAFATLPPAWRAVLPGWTAALKRRRRRQVRRVSDDRPIGPPDPFRALRLVTPEAVKVVVFGQDPYPTAGHADGLAFSRRARQAAFAGADLRGPGAGSARVHAPDELEPRCLGASGRSVAEPGADGGDRASRQPSKIAVGRRSLAEIVQALCQRTEPPVFLLWGAKAQAFFAAAVPPCDPATGAGDPPSVVRLQARVHGPTGSHFVATSDLVDWWCLRSESAARVIVPGSSRRGARVAKGGRL